MILSYRISAFIIYFVLLFSFTECKKDAPTAPGFNTKSVQLYLPANNSPDFAPDGTFEWTKLEEASEYELQISLTNDFKSLEREFSGIKTFYYKISDDAKLNYNSIYYWRIIAKDYQGNLSAFSQIRKLNTIKNSAPEMPDKPSPANGSTEQPDEILLKWNCSDFNKDKLTYDIYLGTDLYTLSKSFENVDSNSYKVNNLIKGVKYYWRILSKDSFGNLTEGPVWTFITKRGPWSSAPGINWGRMLGGCAVVNNGIYYLGGCYYSRINSYETPSISGGMERYNGFSQGWEWLSSQMPATLYSYACVAYQNNIYIFGGSKKENDLWAAENCSYMYDPVSGTWIKNTDLIGETVGAVAAEVNGIIYVIGGGKANFLLNTKVQAYDPVLNTWSLKSAIPTPRYFAAAAVVNNEIYIIGGNSNVDPVNTVEIYNPAKDQWRKGASLPEASFSGCAVSYNNKIYFFGGTDIRLPFRLTCPDCILGNVYEFDPSANAWRKKSSMPNKRVGAAACTINNKIYIIGGCNGSTVSPKENMLGNVDIYDPALDY